MEWNRNALSHLEAILFRIHDSLSSKSDRGRNQPEKGPETRSSPVSTVPEVAATDQELLKAHYFFHQVDLFIDSAARDLVEEDDLPDYEAFDLSKVIRNQVAYLAKEHFGFERPLVN